MHYVNILFYTSVIISVSAFISVQAIPRLAANTYGSKSYTNAFALSIHDLTGVPLNDM